MQKIVLFVTLSLTVLVYGGQTKYTLSVEPIKKFDHFDKQRVDQKIITKSKKDLPQEAGTQSLEHVETKVHSLEKLRKNEVIPAKALALDLNLLTSYAQLSKILRIQGAGKKQNSKEILISNKAVALGKNLLTQKALPAPKISYVQYLLGLTFMDLNQMEDSSFYFEQSIKSNDQAPYADSVSLYLGDFYFDNEKFQQAEKYYRLFEKRLNKNDREYAYFKLAWVYINQSQLKKAEALLVKIIRKKGLTQIEKDSRQTYSFLLAESSDQNEALQKVEALQVQPESHKDLLWNLYLNFQKTPQKPREKIWQALLVLEKDPNQRIKIWLTEIRNFREQGRVQIQMLTFNQMIQDLGTDQIFNQKKLNDFIPEIEQESESLLASFYKSYIEMPSDQNRNRNLMDALNFHLNFKASAKRREILSMKLELLNENKDDQALVSWTDGLLISEAKNIDLTRVREMRADAFERLVKINPALNRQLIQELEFLEKDPQSTQGDVINEKLFALHFTSKNWPAAEAQAAKIYAKNPNEKNLVSMFSVWFEQENCEKINGFDYKGNEPKLIEFRRECALKVAIASRAENGDKEKYYRNILYFIQTSTDVEKKERAIKDLFFNLKKDQRIDLIEKLLQVDFKKSRFNETLSPYTFSISEGFIYQGRWSDLLFLVSQCENEKSCQKAENLKTMGHLITVRPISSELWKKEDAEKKSYFLGLWAVSQSTEFFNHFSKKTELSALEKTLLFISARILNINFQDIKNRNLFRKIEDLVPKREHPIYDLASVKFFDRMIWPADLKKHQLKDKVLLSMSDQVQKNRTQLVSDLKGLGPDQTKALLKKAILAEENMGHLIENSPVPKGLLPDQVNEYKNGVKEISSEFFKQRDEYSTLLGKISEMQLKSETAVNSESKVDSEKDIKFSLGKRDDWIKNAEVAQFPSLDSLWKSQNYFAALLVLDFIKQQEKIADEAYYRIRSGLLLSSQQGQGMMNYVFQELKERKQDSLIKYWESLK